MVYQWKTASRIRADANEAGAMCEKLEKTVGLTPKTLLDANRDVDAPLHNEFEWDDAIAAESYRLSQAGHIIRCLCVASEAKEEESPIVRAFFKTESADAFESLEVIIKDENKHAELLRNAQKELDTYLKKYEALKELNPIRETFKRVFKKERNVNEQLRKSQEDSQRSCED